MTDLKQLAAEIASKCVQRDEYGVFIFRRTVCVEMLEALVKEVRTSMSSNLQKTHCPKGHPYSNGNLKIYGRSRRCKKCTWEGNRERYRTKYSKAARALKSGKQ